MKGKRGGQGFFYGWWVVTGGTVLHVLQGALYFYGFSAFFTPLKQEFGWSATALSGAFSFARLETGIAGPAVGFMIDRWGTRKLMIIGLSMVGLGYFLFARVNSIEMFYVLFVGLVSMGASLAFGAPINAAIANWFSRKRGLALGISSCGIGVGGLGVPVLAWGIHQFGWRPAAIAVAVILLAFGFPLILLMRHKPEPYGYLPDGDGEDTLSSHAMAPVAPSAVEAKGSAAISSAAEVGFSAREALATSAFWMICFAFLFRALITAGIAVHQIPALENAGYAPEAAAGILGAMTFISNLGRLLFGWLADRFDKRYLAGFCMLLQFLGLLVFAYASNFAMIVVFLVVFSPAFGGIIPLMPAMWAEYYGRKAFATISGMAQVVIMWGTIAGPLVAGYTFDLTNSYQFAFVFFAFSNLLGVLFLFFVRKPHSKLAQRGVAS